MLDFSVEVMRRFGWALIAMGFGILVVLYVVWPL